MAEFVMDVYHYQDASSDKLWAICIDGPRVITHWGPRSADRLQGGGPVKMAGRSAEEEAQRLIREKLNEGYKEVGRRLIVDGVIQQGDPATTSASAPDVRPRAYTRFEAAPDWLDQVRAVFRDLDAYTVVEAGERVQIHLGPGSVLELDAPRLDSDGKLRIKAVCKEAHGPRGLLVVLALANSFGAKAYDTDGHERRGDWISHEPNRFQKADLSYEKMKEEAAALGLIMRPLTFKQGATGLGLFA